MAAEQQRHRAATLESCLLTCRLDDQLPEIFSYDFEDPTRPKPWKTDPAANKSDYFNYGFSEETWRVYASEV